MRAKSLVVVAIMGFQGFEEWLRVLVVNDVMFSYRSFFLQGSSRKKKRFKCFLWSFSIPISKTRRRIIILLNPFNNSLPLLSFLFDGYILFTITFIVL
jgi:hypothetical protein